MQSILLSGLVIIRGARPAGNLSLCSLFHVSVNVSPSLLLSNNHHFSLPFHHPFVSFRLPFSLSSILFEISLSHNFIPKVSPPSLLLVSFLLPPCNHNLLSSLRCFSTSHRSTHIGTSNFIETFCFSASLLL